MKKTLKILSVLMVLVLACSVLFIPTSAATVGQIDVTYTIEKYTGTDTVGKEATDIYALTVSLNSNQPINSLLIPIYYESDKFTPVDGSDMSILDWDYTVDYDSGLTRAAYAIPEGSELLDTNKYNNVLSSAADRVVNARGAISGLGRSTVAAAITNLDIHVYSVHPDWWQGVSPDDYGMLTLQYSGQNNYCNLQAFGETRPLISILFKLNPGVSEEDAEGALFGYVPGATTRNDNSVETNPLKFYYDMNSTAGIAAMTANYCALTSGTVAGPAVTKSNAEVKMVLNAEKNAVDFSADKAFQFRVTSSISEEDWNTYFGGNGQNINAVGFVAYNGDGAFDMETAKSVAKGGSAAGYTAATTDYIQKVDGQPANFGARIDFTARENVKDVTYIAFVQYDTDQFAFYDTSYSAALNSNYDKLVSQYAGFIG